MHGCVAKCCTYTDALQNEEHAENQTLVLITVNGSCIPAVLLGPCVPGNSNGRSTFISIISKRIATVLS